MKTINLENYEEYFLLYVDDELNETERRAVHAFLEIHPHLSAELDGFKMAKLPLPSPTTYEHKDRLYKTPGCGINSSNYESYFLKYIDNELTPDDVADVTCFVQQHLQYETALLQLQAAKLVPEEIPFPDKAALYRRSRRKVRQLYAGWMAAAAVAAGLVWLATLHIPAKNDGELRAGANAGMQNATQPKNSVSHEKMQDFIAQKETPGTQPVSASVSKDKDPISLPLKKSKALTAQTAAAGRKQLLQPQVTLSIMPPDELQQPRPPVEIAVVDQKHTVRKVPDFKPLNEVEEIAVTITSDAYSGGQNAVYKELDTNEEQTLYIGSLQLNKARVNGLLKKATHLLGRKSQQQEL